jgi:phosphoglucomutase
VLCGELGCPEEWVLHSEPLPDFGGLHPDPNLAYAQDLVKVCVEEGQRDTTPPAAHEL